MSDEPGATTDSHEAELASLLQSLSMWMNGMATFIAASKSEWQHASIGRHLGTQNFRQHTLRLKRETQNLAEKIAPSNVTINDEKGEVHE